MSDEIRASYEELEQIAQRFTAAQEEVELVLQNVRRAYQPLEEGSWIGRAFDDFSSEMNDLVFPAVNRLSSALGEASKTVTGVAATMQQADEEAGSLFKGLGS
jgi:WXG100 family type VII secretion target